MYKRIYFMNTNYSYGEHQEVCRVSERVLKNGSHHARNEVRDIKIDRSNR